MLSEQAKERRFEVLREIRLATARGYYGLDENQRNRIFWAQCAVADWNRTHDEDQITSAEITTPEPATR